MAIKTWVTLGIVYVVLVFAAYGVITGNNPFEDENSNDHDTHASIEIQLEEQV